MTAKILDGKALAKTIELELQPRIAALGEDARPGLAVILVGEHPASRVYVKNKIAACERAGIRSFSINRPANIDKAALRAAIERLNRDDAVDGILVQLPLPDHLSDIDAIEAISPDKDVDGFHCLSAGALMVGREGFRPCTPAGVMRLIRETGIPLSGTNAVVVGRSNIVGKPQALMLLEADATVTIAHSRTKHLAELTRSADVLVVAVGREAVVTADMIKPGAVVIDVGMNRNAEGKLCGDVAPDAVEVAGWLTPVPGGVGPMTIAMLLENTVTSAERRARR